jgi:hypothetical protein
MTSELAEASSPRRLWGWAIFIALAGIAARALWYVQYKEDLPLRAGPDGDIYLGQAKAILNGSIGDPNATGLASVYCEAFAPGYAMFMAGLWSAVPRGDVFRNADYALLIVYATQWVLAGLTTLMTFALARRVLFGWSALVPVVIVTLSIALVDMPNMFAYETLLAFLLTGAVLLLIKSHSEELPELSERPWQERPPRNWQWLYVLFAGIALSAAILVQPRVAIFLPFAAWWLVRAARGRYAILFLVFALVLPGAWIARGYAHFNQLVPISINPEASLYMDNVDPVGGMGYVAEATPPQCNRDWLFAQDLQQHFVWGHCMVRAGANLVVDQPGESARAVPDRLVALFSPWNPDYARGQYSSDKWGYQDAIPQSARDDTTYKQAAHVLVIILMSLYALMMLVGIYGLWLEGPGSAPRIIAIPLIVLPLIHLFFHAENRFRLPVLPLIAIAITLGVVTTWDAIAMARQKKL